MVETTLEVRSGKIVRQVDVVARDALGGSRGRNRPVEKRKEKEK